MKNKGRLIAGAIFLTPILMLILSTTLYYSGYSPEERPRSAIFQDEASLRHRAG